MRVFGEKRVKLICSKALENGVTSEKEQGKERIALGLL
jgi:hypothetical protein